ncbi:amidohydrolase family protein [Sphingobium sp. EM0848]|uniref:N-acyl-D-amino-acid deacylase family protein n=1 Tax=Sphingobium sp. EM0848 TaxID=2743473 RepID=UPI00159C6DF5|nr:amidohydrolase family protein [Sphingobium sp. EM0848]
MSRFDVVIRNGTVVDGRGGDPWIADVGIVGDRIAAIGRDLAPGAEEIDATGLIVTPGFVDIHTHYDGQVTWDNHLRPSTSHGVTTILMGNCGVGFAPCRPEQREMLVRLMEGVEDIPNPVLTEGLPWNWESFPDYLDSIADKPFDADVAALLPHAALRVYVMGERGEAREAAKEEDIARMTALVCEAVKAGALGIGTSRTMFHRSIDGHLIPTLTAEETELQALADAMTAAGGGTFQFVSDFADEDAEFDMILRIAERSGRPITFPAAGTARDPARSHLLARVRAANQAGQRIGVQVLGRPTGAIMGHQLTLHPFCTSPTYKSLAHLPFEEKIARLQRPEIKAAILADPLTPDPGNALTDFVFNFDRIFPLGDNPDYEPSLADSVAGRARALDMPPAELAYDLLLEKDGKRQLYITITHYAEGNLDGMGQIIMHPDSVMGLGDGGAHYGAICDASYSTYLLTHWVRDRERGRVPLPRAIKAMTRDTAELVGLRDRGVLAEGYRADINVIDLENLRLHAPEVVFDLPAGGRRLMQRADGYRLTMLAGQIVSRKGEPTGALPGRLVRGAQPAPVAAA